MEIKKNCKQKLPVRGDNRRMTGNVNIYICSETIEKGHAELLDVDEISKSDSVVSIDSEKTKIKRNPATGQSGKLMIKKLLNHI